MVEAGYCAAMGRDSSGAVLGAGSVGRGSDRQLTGRVVEGGGGGRLQLNKNWRGQSLWPA